MVARMLTAGQIAALRLPTAQEMQTVAASIPQLERGSWQAWETAPGSFLEVAPGMIRLVRKSAHIDDAARDRRFAQRVAQQKHQLACERALYRSPMALLTDVDVRAAEGGSGVPLVAGKRITAWSRKSRSRMNQQLRRLDFTPLFNDGLEPAMVTLTMPGTGNDGDRNYWQQLTPTPAAFKRMLDNFTRAYARAWGKRISGVWKMEFQQRGAPHVHILMTPPAGIAHDSEPFEFPTWLSRTWARIVGADGDARVRHERAGTGIDYVGEAYRDPQRIAVYFGKHGFFGQKDYQNQLPKIWADAIESGASGARYWGVWSLKKASAVLELDQVGSVSIEVLIDPLGVSRIAANIIRHYRLFRTDGTRSGVGGWLRARIPVAGGSC